MSYRHEGSKVAASHFCRYDDPVSLQGGAWLRQCGTGQLLDWAHGAGIESLVTTVSKQLWNEGSGSVSDCLEEVPGCLWEASVELQWHSAVVIVD